MVQGVLLDVTIQTDRSRRKPRELISSAILYCSVSPGTVGRAQPSLSEVLGIGYSSKKHFSQSCPEPSIYHLLTVTGEETSYSVSTPQRIHFSFAIPYCSTNCGYPQSISMLLPSAFIVYSWIYSFVMESMY